MKYAALISGILVLGVFVLYIFFTFLYKDPVLVQPNQTMTGLTIQPDEALEIAAPHIGERALDVWREDKPLNTYIILDKDWYYIQRSNYPAKTLRYYMKPAVKVHTMTGEVGFTD